WDLPGLAGALLFERTADLLLRRHYAARHARRWLAAGAGFACSAGAVTAAAFKPVLRRFCAQASLLQVLDIVVWDRSEMLFLKHFCDIRQVAFYSLGFNITQRLLLLPRAFVSAVSASVMVRIGKDAESAAALTIAAFRLMAVAALPISFGVGAMSDPIVRILYGPRFLPAIPVLALLAVFASAKALMFPAQDFLVAASRQGLLLELMIGAAALNLLLNFLLIPHHGAMGAAVANSAAQTAAAFLAWLAALQGFRARFPLRPFARILLAAACAGAAALVLVERLRGPLAPPLAVLAAIAVYALGLRFCRVLEPDDRERLREWTGRLPASLRLSVNRAISWLAPEP
ncbi:MAG: lipopolysaccharide biosynthesis protein, partial [Bryobacteraceae bacterium]